jgi:hypothetical protein
VLLLEIAAQGVRGFAPERGRLALRPGYNVVAVDGAALRRVVAALFHPDLPADPALRVDGAGTGAGGAVRAGLTLTGDDGVTWRVVRDMAGGSQLQRYDPEKRAFQSVLQDPVRIAGVLRAAGVPSPERYAAVLSVAASDFPSRQAPSVLAGAMLAAPQRRVATSPGERSRKLAAARAELERAHAAEQIQSRMDAAQSHLFKLEEMLKSGEQVKERLRAARAGVEAFAAGEAALATLGDPVARLAACRRVTARRDESLAKVAAEREAQEGAPGAVPPPLLRQPGFLAGLGIGAVALLAGLFTEMRSLALAAIPATGWAAFEGLRWVGRAEEAQQAARRARWLSDRERKANELWARETADVRAAMASAGVATLAELEDLHGRAREARAGLVEAEAGFTAWQGRAETQDAETERAAVQQEIGVLERQLTGETGGFVRDVHSLEQEIERLEREAETGPFEPLGEEAVGEPVAAPPRGEPLRTLMERASADLGLTPGAALRALQPRVLQLLPALSGQRLTNFFVDERGNLQVQAGGKLVPSVTLGAPERDLCFAVLKVAFLEQGLAAGKSVAVLDDALAVLPEGSRRALARVLKQLARGRQIVHGSSDVAFREAADSAG